MTEQIILLSSCTIFLCIIYACSIASRSCGRFFLTRILQCSTSTSYKVTDQCVISLAVSASDFLQLEVERQEKVFTVRLVVRFSIGSLRFLDETTLQHYACCLVEQVEQCLTHLQNCTALIVGLPIRRSSAQK